MSKSNAAENDYLGLIYKGTAIANIADNAASSPLTAIFLALHTADPGESGTQSTSECTYTGYVRKSVARGAGFNLSGNVVTLAADAEFAPCTAGSETASFFSTGVASSGATKILHSGSVTPPIIISNGVTPILTTATSITED